MVERKHYGNAMAEQDHSLCQKQSRLMKNDFQNATSMFPGFVSVLSNISSATLSVDIVPLVAAIHRYLARRVRIFLCISIVHSSACQINLWLRAQNVIS